jgi:class 3 adenylate cyclase
MSEWFPPSSQGVPQVAVVLVADVVGSTELHDRLGADRFERWIAELDALVDATVAACGGWVVKRTGDGAMAAFLSASAAVTAAVRLQQAVARRQRFGPDEPVTIRVTAAAGDVTFARGDVHGRAPFIAARMGEVAGPGEVLVTDAVRVMAIGRNDLTFVPLGLRPLRGLDEPVRCCTVPWSPASRTADLVGFPASLDGVRLGPFVGRGEALADLTAVWHDVVAGSGRVVLVRGEPGIGKTRLLARLAEMVVDDGGLVLHGWCDELLDAPFQPFAQVVRAIALASDGLDLSLVRTATELSRVVPELLDIVPGATPPSPVDPDTGRHRLYAAFRAWIEEVSSDGPVAVLIDDLTWANRSTLDLFAVLADAVAELPVLLVGSLRDTDPRPELQRTMNLVAQRPHGRLLQLRGLPTDELEQLLEVLAGGELGVEPAGLVRELRRLTGGNPFFVHELVRHWRDQGRLDEGGPTPFDDLLHPGAVPAAVGDVVRRRLLHLSDPALAVVRAASVCVSSVPVELLADLVALGPDELFGAVKEACESGLLRERPDGTLWFHHALVRQTVYSDLPIGVRRLQHRRAGEAIERMGGQTVDPNLSALAYHFGRATSADVEKAVDYAIRAAGTATHHLDHAYAAMNLEEAAALVTRSGAPLDPGLRSDLLRSLGMARDQAGLLGGRELLLEAGRIAAEDGDAARCAAAALANTRGTFSLMAPVDAERIAALEVALALPGHDAGARAALLANLGVELYVADPERCEQVSAEAVVLAERSGDPEVVVRSLALRLVCLWRPGRLPERVELARRLLRHVEAHPLPMPYRLFGTAVTHQVFIEAGLMEEGIAAFQEALALAGELGSPMVLSTLQIRSSVWQTTICNFDDALAIADQVVSLQRQGGSPDAELAGMMLRVFAHYLRGDLGEVLDEAEEFAVANPQLSFLSALVAGAAAEHDDRERCERMYARLVADGFRFPEDPTYLASLSFTGHAAMYLGDRDGVERVTGLLEPHADAYIDCGALHLGPVVQQLARLHGFLGRHELADEEFAEVLQLTDRSIGPWSFVAVRVNWAAYLLDRGVDPSRVQLLLEAARPAANRYGLRRMQRLIAELDLRLRA